VTYLISFACYGAHLHGDESGSVDRLHNLPGTRAIAADAGRAALERRLMSQPPYSLDQLRRDAVLAAFLQRASLRGWTILAAHVRANHLHLIIDADAAPERVMNDLKAYASRHLNALGLDAANQKRWARHGSTRWLRDQKNIEAAIRYVIEGQGDPMALYVSNCLRR
jgi:REP element-mobilizing transposase RayT